MSPRLVAEKPLRLPLIGRRVPNRPSPSNKIAVERNREKKGARLRVMIHLHMKPDRAVTRKEGRVSNLPLI
tara:strand:- start:348 stop:560 length:213 start_codon:yes stop_codon:yes gene_type:complete